MRSTLHQNLKHFSNILLIVFQCYFSLKGNNLLQSTCFYFVWHVILQMLLSICIGPHGELEHIRIIIAYEAKHFECGLMVLFGLSTKAGNDVGGNGAIRQIVANGLDAIKIPFWGVMSIH